MSQSMDNHSSTYLEDYAILTSGNEAPVKFHRWAALSTLSHAVGRKVWTDWGILGKIFPHLYLIFVGDPGIKKSTAMNIAKQLVINLKDIPIAGESITRESMTQMLGDGNSRCAKVYKWEDKPVKYAQLSIFANELVNLLNSGGNPIGMIDFFTDVWDQEVFRVETKNKGTDVIMNPYISILGCLTPETIRTLMAQKVISGGMTRRCIFVMGDKSAFPVAFPEVTPEQHAARERINKYLLEVKALAGKFVWEPEARDYFEQWYNQNFERKRNETDIVLNRFLETKPELVIKVAMLIALGRDLATLRVTAENLEAAVHLLTESEMTGPYLFAGTGRNELSPIAVNLLRILEIETMPVTKKNIYKMFHKDATTKELDEVLDHLIRTEQISVATVQANPVSKVVLVSTVSKMNDYLKQLSSAGKAQT